MFSDVALWVATRMEVTYNSSSAACAKIGEMMKAEFMFSDVALWVTMLMEVAYNSLSAACAKSGNVQKTENIFQVT